jgi:low temperature requirement protein LtrA
MIFLAARANHLRTRRAHEHNRVTYVELFFDLVFVFAITQLSHGLLEHMTLQGALQTGFLMLAVWWLWINVSWMTNWLDPEKAAVRLILMALMLAGLVLSASIPHAFEERAQAFVLAYVFMQVARTLFMLWALRAHSPRNFRNFQRIMAWVLPAAALWTAGAFAGDGWRYGLWGLALAIEYASPWFGFWTPGLGRSSTADWDVEGGHMAERCGLFIIIALGESILVTGATFSNLAWTAETGAAFVVAFVGSVAMWWVYFNIGAERGSRKIAGSDDPGRMARMAYTYLHIPIVAGVIVAAVADELVLAHPGGHVEAKAAAAILGGPALYLVGNALFKRTSFKHVPLSHLAGLGLLALLVPVCGFVTPLILSAGTTTVLIVVAVWEWMSLGRRGHAAHPADA